jgi:hypothetical protein
LCFIVYPTPFFKKIIYFSALADCLGGIASAPGTEGNWFESRNGFFKNIEYFALLLLVT